MISYGREARGGKGERKREPGKDGVRRDIPNANLADPSARSSSLNSIEMGRISSIARPSLRLFAMTGIYVVSYSKPRVM